MSRRVPLGWKMPRGRPLNTRSDQLKKDSGKTVGPIDTLAPGSRQIAVEEGRDGLASLRDLVVVVVVVVLSTTTIICTTRTDN